MCSCGARQSGSKSSSSHCCVDSSARVWSSPSHLLAIVTENSQTKTRHLVRRGTNSGGGRVVLLSLSLSACAIWKQQMPYIRVGTHKPRHTTLAFFGTDRIIAFNPTPFLILYAPDNRLITMVEPPPTTVPSSSTTSMAMAPTTAALPGKAEAAARTMPPVLLVQNNGRSTTLLNHQE